MKKILGILILAIAFIAVLVVIREDRLGAFNTVRGFATLPSNTSTEANYTFGVTDIPIERAGAASSSTGFEFGKFLNTSATGFTVATTSTGFAITMNQSGRIKGCSFDLQTLPNTGTVSVMIQKNGTLQANKYCKLPRSATFATKGGLTDMSTNDILLDDNITFAAGDRFGLIASSSGLNAATFDGLARLIIQLNN